MPTDPDSIQMEITRPAEKPAVPQKTVNANLDPSAVELEQRQQADTGSALGNLFNELAPELGPTPPPTETTTPTQPPPGEQPPGTEPPTGTPVGTEDPFKKQLSEFEPQPGTHPNAIQGIKKLQAIAEQEHNAAVEASNKVKELETKYNELQEKLKNPELPEDVKKQLDDYKQMTREVDLRNDPEFQNKYVKPIQNAEKSIMTLLKESGLKEEHQKEIEKRGGILAMSQSNRPLNEKMTESQWIDEVLLPKMPSFKRNLLMSHLTKALDLGQSAQQEITEFRAGAEERRTQHQEASAKQFDAGRAEAVAAIGELAVKKDVPANATPEQKLEIEKHNGRIEAAEKRFAEYLPKMNDPKVAGGVLVKAAQADSLMEYTKELQTKLSAAHEWITKVKAAGSHSTAGNAAPPPGTPEAPNKKALLQQSDSSALGDLLTKAGL